MARSFQVIRQKKQPPSAFVWAATLATLFLAGCGLHETATPKPDATQIGIDSEFTLKLTDIPVPLVSLVNGRRTTLKCSCVIVGDTTARREFAHRLAEFADPEFKWLLIFVEHAVVRYVNDGISTPGVEIRAPASSGMRRGIWWIADAEGTTYDENTLSLSRNGQLLKILFETDSPNDMWLPFTYQTYPAWWNRVDQRLKLTELFLPRSAVAANGTTEFTLTIPITRLNLSPKQTLLVWDSSQLTGIDEIVEICSYSGDEEKRFALIVAEEAIAYTELQRAVVAKWDGEAESLVLHAAGCPTQADDEQAEELIGDADHAIIKFKLGSLQPLPLRRVDGVWKIDIAALAQSCGNDMKNAEKSVRQITGIVNAATIALGRGNYTDAKIMAKELGRKLVAVESR